MDDFSGSGSGNRTRCCGSGGRESSRSRGHTLAVECGCPKPRGNRNLGTIPAFSGDSGGAASDSFSIPAHGQITKTNVVFSVFGLVNAKGALSIISEDGAPVVVASRTYTYGADGGSYGQEVFGILSKDRAWAGGLENDSLFRTNFGIYVPIDPVAGSVLSFEAIFRNAGGEEIGRETINFPAAGMIQRSLSTVVGDAVSSASIELVCSDSGAVWYAYVSRVDQISGDAVFRPLRGMTP